MNKLNWFMKCAKMLYKIYLHLVIALVMHTYIFVWLYVWRYRQSNHMNKKIKQKMKMLTIHYLFLWLYYQLDILPQDIWGKMFFQLLQTTWALVLHMAYLFVYTIRILKNKSKWQRQRVMNTIIFFHILLCILTHT